MKAAYRFFDNSKVNCSSILKPHQENTVERIKKYKRVLFIQDTTYFTYGNDKTSTTGLDVCCKHFSGKTIINGLMMHGTLAVSEDGTPLGLIEQKFIKRNKFRGDQVSLPRKGVPCFKCVARFTSDWGKYSGLGRPWPLTAWGAEPLSI